MEWSIQEVARIAGTTSRTLRHYDERGILPPTRIGANGYRYYDQAALVQLQRVLLLRELGLSLPEIARILAREQSVADALSAHLRLLRQERLRLKDQISAVEKTVQSLKDGRPLMAEEIFAGFDHTQYRQEVEERWGKQAYAASDRWWRQMGEEDREAWMGQLQELNSDWQAAAQDANVGADSERAQALAGRHIEWLKTVPGAPTGSADELAQYVRSLGEMYVADERFAANYGGRAGAEFVRDALVNYLAMNE